MNWDGERFLLEKIPGNVACHEIKPGLSGLAQVNGRYDFKPREKLRYDFFYVKNQSFWLDLKLIALSFWITFRGKWESRIKKF